MVVVSNEPCHVFFPVSAVHQMVMIIGLQAQEVISSYEGSVHQEQDRVWNDQKHVEKTKRNTKQDGTLHRHVLL